MVELSNKRSELNSFKEETTVGDFSKSFPELKEEIENIEFAFKNAQYNKNRLFEELERGQEGFNFEEKEKFAKQIGLTPGKKFELKIPITLWSDIAFFEFHAYLFTQRGGAQMYAYDVDGDWPWKEDWFPKPSH